MIGDWARKMHVALHDAGAIVNCTFHQVVKRDEDVVRIIFFGNHVENWHAGTEIVNFPDELDGVPQLRGCAPYAHPACNI